MKGAFIDGSSSIRLAKTIITIRTRGAGMADTTSDLSTTASLAIALADVQSAQRAIAGAVLNTDCDESRTLGEILQCRVWLKFENLQFTATFKERGALNRLLALDTRERQRGVIAMSAGNHAQGVAYHAKRLHIPATIVMPVGTPMVKVENTKRHGATVIVEGATLEESASFAQIGRAHV